LAKSVIERQSRRMISEQADARQFLHLLRVGGERQASKFRALPDLCGGIVSGRLEVSSFSLQITRSPT
jgi:hypothetical protein